MRNYTSRQASIIESFLNCISTDTDNEIDFLVNGLYIDEEEINSMGCEEISELVYHQVKYEIDFDIFVNAVSGMEIKGFDSENIYDSHLELTNSDQDLKQPCKNPCPTCPYTKNAIAGDFGGNDRFEKVIKT